MRQCHIFLDIFAIVSLFVGLPMILSAEDAKDRHPAADWRLTRYRLSKFSLFESGFDRGDYLQLGIDSVNEFEQMLRVRVECNQDQDVEFLEGSNHELSAELKMVGRIDTLCTCLDSLQFFSLEGEEDETFSITVSADLAATVALAGGDNSSHATSQEFSKHITLLQVGNLPFLRSISPTRGPPDVETNVTISVQSKSGNSCKELFCRFLGRTFQVDIPTVAISEDCKEIVCPVPPVFDHTQSSHVLVGLSDGVEESNFVHFFHEKNEATNIVQTDATVLNSIDMVVKEIIPGRGPITGGSSILLIGEEYTDNPNIRCKFGTMSVRARWISPSEVECMSPRQPSSGLVNVSLGIGDGFSASSGVQFEYYNDTIIVDFEPKVGPVVGGIKVNVIVDTALYETDDLVCRFGIVAVPGKYLNADVVQCSSPPNRAGAAVSLSISRNGGHDYSLRSKQSLAYFSSPTIDAVSPFFGRRGRRTKVKVEGSGFQPDGLSSTSARCVFGENSTVVAPSFIARDGIHCDAPVSSTTGSIPFHVTIGNEGSIKSDTFIFHYVEDYMITSISPDYSHISGGSDIIIWGENLMEVDVVVCKFGESSVNATYSGFGKILCVTPPNPPGDMPLFIAFGGESFDDTGLYVHYSDTRNHTVESVNTAVIEEKTRHVENKGEITVVAPIVEQVLLSDSNGFPSGTLGFTITGDNFVRSPNLSCKIGSKPGTVTWISQYQIDCQAAIIHESHQSLDISVSNDGINFVKTSFALSEQRSFSIYTTQHVAATRRILVSGSPFTENSNWICVMNKHRVVAEVLTKNSLVCTLPPNVHKDQISLRVCQDEMYCSEDMVLKIFNHISIYNVAPLSGTLEGGTLLKFRMLHAIGPNAKCRFGGQDTDIRKSDELDSFYYCSTPSVQSPQKVEILISLDGKHFSASQLIFTYLPSFTLSKMYPTRILVDQTASTLRIYGNGFVNLHSLTCKFDDDALSRAIWVSDAEVWCSVPKLDPGQAQVFLSYDNFTKSENSLVLTIVARSVQIFSIFPTCGPGGTKVEVCGTNLNLNSRGHCHFGEEQIPLKLDDSACAECLAPFREAGRKENVTLSFDGLRVPHVQTNTEFTFVPITIESFTPDRLQLNRKRVEFKVRGAGFECLSPDTFCQIGNVTSGNISISSSTLLLCIFDRLPVSGIYKLELVNSYLEVVSEFDNIKIIEAPIISSIKPRWIVNGTKNNVLEVRGKNLRDGDFACFVGGVPSTKAIVTGDDRALCFVGSCPIGTNEVHVSNDGIQESQSLQAIQCLAPSAIDRINPNFGLSGTVINVTGVNFRMNCECFFGSERVVPARFINSTLLQCQAPSLFSDWNTTLQIKVDGRDISLSPSKFDFTMIDVGINAISPSHGSVRGGTHVTIELNKGQNNHISHCWFGLIQVPAYPDSSDDRVNCITPHQNNTGVVSVGLSTNGQDSTDDVVLFEYMDDIIIKSVHPAKVSELGGSMLTVRGGEFPNTNELSCVVGKTRISANWVSESIVECELPALAPGEYKIGVSSNGKDQVSAPEGSSLLQVFHTITLTRLLPSVGRTTGNTKVTLQGTNFFMSPGLGCKFGSVFTKAAYLSSNEIQCWTPSWSTSENAQVSVSINGKSVSNHLRFRFIEPFEFLEVKHRFLPIDGGTIIVSGNGPFKEENDFQEKIECLIGEEFVAAKLRSDDTIVCDSPHNIAGVVVQVSIRYGQGDIFLVRNGQLTYYKRSNITSAQVMPASTLGSSRIVLHGDNLHDHFKNGVFCRFPQGTFVPGLITGPSNTIICDIEAGNSEVTEIEVSHSRQGDLTESIKVSMDNPLQVLSSNPNIGLVGKSHLISITGHGYFTTQSIYCSFDKHSFVPAHVINSTLMQCLMPAQSTMSETKLDISVNRHIVLSQLTNLRFISVDLQVNSIHPSHGSVRGGTHVTIELNKGQNNHISHCWFGLIQVPAYPDSSDDRVNCITPHQNNTGVVSVGLSTNGQDSTDDVVLFEYMDDIIIQSVHPAKVSELGGSMLTVRGGEFPNTNELSCVVGETRISANWVSESIVECELPALAPGAYKIGVANVDRGCNSAFSLKVYPELVVDRHTVTTRDDVFYVDLMFTRIVKSYIPHISCEIDSRIVPSFFLERNMLSCEIPFQTIHRGDKGFELGLLIDGEKSQTSPQIFEVLLPPFIRSVDPAQTSSQIDTLVTVFGAFEHYLNTTSYHRLCKFGTMVTSMTGMPNSTHVQCSTPSHPRGEDFGISISFDGGMHWSNSLLYEFRPPVHITSFYPTKVPSIGDVAVFLVLDNCEARMNLRCRFGPSIELAVWVSTSMIQCITPPHSPGFVSLALLDEKDQIIGEKIPIYVHDAPRIHTLYPRFGVLTGGTQVRFIGRELDSLQEPYCFFGASGTLASIIGSGSLQCTSPPQGQINNVTISVVDRLTSFEWLADFQFEYTRTPHVTFAEHKPSANAVILSGKNLNSTGTLWCRFDESFVVTIINANESQALCPLQFAPSLSMGNSIFVQVSNNEVDWTPKVEIQIQSKVYVKSVWPLEGAVDGGTILVIDTAVPVYGQGLNCFFGKVSVSSTLVSMTKFRCVSPRFDSPGYVPLTFGFGHDPPVGEGIIFKMQPPCTINDIQPRFSQVDGGDEVTIFGTNFVKSRAYSCSFGAMQVPALRLDLSTLKCVIPGHAIGSIRISITSDVGDECSSDSADTEIEFIEPPTILEAIPSIVPVSSTANITLLGRGFNDEVHRECAFDGHLVNAVVHSPTELICIVSILETSRTGLVVLKFPTTKAQIEILIVPQPRIKSFTPSAIGPRSNLTLEIVGYNFLNSAQLTCAFGDQRFLVPAQWVSTERILCQTPTLDNEVKGGSIPLSISVNNGYHNSNVAKLNRKPALQITSISTILGFVSSELMLRADMQGLESTASYHCEGKYWRVRAEILNGGKSIQCILPRLDHRVEEVRLTDGHDSIVLGKAAFSEKPEIMSLNPLHGFESETSVQLTGTSLDHVRFCIFTSLDEVHIRHVRKIQHISTGIISCQSPPSIPGDVFSVDVSADGFNAIQTGLIFQHRDAPKIRSLEPLIIPHGQRNKIKIKGRNFVDSKVLSCYFDKKVVQAHFVSSQELFCLSPALEPGSYQVSISSNEAHFALAPVPLHVYLPIGISQINPKYGNVDGGEIVTLSVTNAPYNSGMRLRCRFGLQLVPAQIMNKNSIACHAPKVITEGGVSLSVTINGIDFHEGPYTFMYLRPPIILRISPNQGTMTGGTIVRFYLNTLVAKEANRLFCYFGPQHEVEPSSIGTNFVDCISPPSNADVTKVKVSLHYSLTEYSSFDGPIFFYLRPVTVVHIHPFCGPANGGTEIRVTGNNFPQRQDLVCLFGDASTPAEFISEQVLRCKTPEYNATGTVKVKISTSDTALATYQSAGIFQYMTAFTIDGVYPNQGSLRGGTEVTIKGSRFSDIYPNLMFCQFGDVRVQARFISSQEIGCTSPPLQGSNFVDEDVDLGVSLNGADFTFDRMTVFQYVPHSRIVSIFPASGSTRGGTAVMVDFISTYKVDGSSDIQCHFGVNEVTAEIIRIEKEHIRIMCIAPTNAESVSVDLELSLNGKNDLTTSGIKYIYYDVPIVASIRPKFGFTKGGELVTVKGKDFPNSSTLRCMFGTTAAIKTTWISSNEVHCFSPPVQRSQNTSVCVVTDGMETSELALVAYEYRDIPIFDRVNSTVVKPDGSSVIAMRGRNLGNALSCRIGQFSLDVPVLSNADSVIVCRAPAQNSSSPYIKNIVQMSVAFQSGYLPTGLFVSYSDHDDPNEIYSESLNDQFYPPSLASISPSTFDSNGGDWITLKGQNFSNREGLSCQFHDLAVQKAVFISTNEIKCRSPRMVPGSYNFYVTNGYNLESLASLRFHVTNDASVISTHPSSGPLHGGTLVVVKCNFAMKQRDLRPKNIACQFGTVDVPGILQDSNSILCISPPVLKPKVVEISLSFDGKKSYTKSMMFYTYKPAPHVKSLNPSYGSISGGVHVLVEGENFSNSDQLKCRFGSGGEIVAIFLSSKRIICITPLQLQAQELNVDVSTNGVDFSDSKVTFKFEKPLYVESVFPPSSVSSVNGSRIYMTMRIIPRNLDLYCIFHHSKVKARILEDRVLECKSPGYFEGAITLSVASGGADNSSFISNTIEHTFYPPPKILKTIPRTGSIPGRLPLLLVGEGFVNSTDLSCEFNGIVIRANYIRKNLIMCSTPPLLNEKHLSVKVSPSGSDFSSINGFPFNFTGSCSGGHYCGYSTTTWTYPAPNGTYSSEGSSNFTLCNPGTFSPRLGQTRCLPCAVGYFCPDFGNIKPVICPPGKVCDGIGLATPRSSCPKGHYCLSGTKSRVPLTFESSDDWMIEKETGIANDNRNPLDYTLRNRVPPASGKYRLEHDPHEIVVAEQPIPCNIGYYCREGVASPIPIETNFSTPQPCFDGFFCPRGSSTPEGSGPCKTGYYCPSTTVAVVCPKGHHCPGIANIKPFACHPGSYSNSTGSSSCRLCEIGHMCPKSGMATPQPCPAGFICDIRGLSVPDKLCTPGFICEEGTSTDDPDSDINTRPFPCPAGNFCLAGVAQKSAVDWLPNKLEGKIAPQECLEGFYCEVSSPLPTGICFPGHYCPPGSWYPKQVPVGTFADEGAIVPALCFPGSYAAATGSSQCLPCPAGNSCRGYGISVPSICDYGTYRSVADSITCRPCPPATYLPYRGGSDVSECLPVPPGRASGGKGVADLSSSDPCDGSHVCSSATENSNQYDHKCSGGHYCSRETTPISQFRFLCDEGHQCKRGTSEQLKGKDRCPKNYFCPLGTSDSSTRDNHCPRQTTTFPGSNSVHDCVIQDVDVCDKVPTNPQNPGEYNSYYTNDQLLLPNETPSDTDDSLINSGEIVTLRKIIPYISGPQMWQNETVEVFRSCPSFAMVENSTSWLENRILLTGRNFRQSSALTCRFRIKLLKDESFQYEVVTEGTFVTHTRISCELPPVEPIEDALLTLVSENKSCITNSDGSMYFKAPCDNDDDETCIGSYLKNDRHQRHVSLFIPCTEMEIATDTCDNNPSTGFRMNSCFGMELLIDASNNGLKFSGTSTYIPFTVDTSVAKSKLHKDYVVPQSSALLTVLHPFLSQFKLSNTNIISQEVVDASRQILQNHKSQCLNGSFREEGTRASEADWFELPFMSQAHLSIDWTHVPRKIMYDEHFKLAIFAIPSRCTDTLCNDGTRSLVDEETLPCVKPLSLPKWFTDVRVDKHQHLNLTMLALDDMIFKAEIHVVHGLYLPLSSFFTNTMTVDIVHPRRDKYSDLSDRRKLSPYISWEEREVQKEFIFAARLSSDNTRTVSLPLNLPPRWDDLERGRVLLSMNTTQDSITPTIKDDPRPLNPTNSFWENPFKTIIDAKENTDAFLETFHGVSVGSDGGYDYDMKSVMLPYLPFISNCREFDSYLPLSHAIASRDCKLPPLQEFYPDDWWRREYEALPHQDYIEAVGPFDFHSFYPVADWCERKIYCEYEENLNKQDVTPRWFEASTGTTIFSVIRDPVDYFQYTGRPGARTSLGDGGGEAYMKSIDLFDTFIPVKLKRLGDSVDCSFLCIPRKITLDISYHQVNETSKRLVEIVLVLEDFDRNSTDSKYELDLKFYPLNYQQLIVKFAYSKEIFLLLFSIIGMFTVAVSFFYWVVVRLTTRVEHPPKLRFGSTLWLIFPQAVSGFSLGLVPIIAVTAGITLLLKGYLFITPLDDPTGLQWPVFQTTKLHYQDTTIDPQLLKMTRQGRLGMALLAVAIVSICEGSKMFVPKRDSKRERELELLREKDASKTMVWDVTQWKRGNLIFCSVLMGLFLVMIVEWSYWSYFGTYIWEAILLLKILNTIVGIIVDRQMGESLLSAPIMTAMSLVETIVTLSAVDFLDFLLSYVVGFGFLLLERMYISPYQGDVLDWLGDTMARILKSVQLLLEKYGVIRGKGDSSTDKPLVPSQTEGTVEPIIDSYGSYCLETLALLYVPYVIVLLMIFRDDIELPIRYGIKEQDMEYYALFAVLIIPFQIASDIFLQGALELFHGWKIYDYLVYTRYRFLQRETRWKGFEDSLDECIDESVRTMDHMCFSTQFYMMMTIHVNGIIYMVLGIQMISRAQYNLFGDPATPVVLMIVIISVAVLKKVLIWLSFILGIWSIRHENTAWHANMKEEDNFKLPDWDDVKGASHDAFEMNKRISSDTFRYKFMNYNRSWLIEQLPNVLTPRTLRRSKPFLTNQLARVIQALNDGISSDSDSEVDTKRFETPNLSPDATSLMKDWVREAKRRLMMKEAVQTFIEKSKNTHCEKCLSRKFLKTQTQISLDEMDAIFKRTYPGSDFDRGLWKQFWFRQQTYHTLCLPCISNKKDADRRKGNREEPNQDWGAILLDDASKDMLTAWYNGAQQNLFGKDGKPRAKIVIDVSDDDDDDTPDFPWNKERIRLNASSSKVAQKWLRTARARMQQRIDE